MQHHQVSSGLHKRQRVIATSSTSTAAARRTTTRAAAAAAAAAATTPASVGRSGAAATGADATKLAATNPPGRTGLTSSYVSSQYADTFATLQSGYKPQVSAASSTAAESSSALASLAPSSAASQTGSSASAAAATGTGAQPILSQGALIGIIAGAAALGIILLVTLGCCCWKRKKAKKDEQKWWKINESQGNVAGTPGAGIAMRSGVGPSSDARGRGVAEEKDWTAGGATDGGWGDDKSSMSGRREEQEGARPFAARQASDLQSARQELFEAALAPRSASPGGQSNYHHHPQHDSHRGPAINPFLSRDDSTHSLHSQFPPPRFTASPAPSHAYTERSLYSHHSGTSSAKPLLAQSPAPSRPPRPSEVPSAAAARSPPSHFAADRRDTQQRNDQIESRFREVMTGAVGRPTSEAVTEAEEEEERRRERQSVARRKKDTVLDFADVYGQADEEGGTDWDHQATSASANVDTALVPPQRSSSKRTAGQLGGSRGAPPVPSADVNTTFFPPQSRSAFVASTTEATARHGPRYSSRVDSKPLRELEDILDSFADGPRRTTQPPLPADAASMRSNSVRSATSSNANQRPPVGTGMVASSSSSSSLFAPGYPQASYTLNHHHNSFHSSTGELGSHSLVKSHSGAPLASPPLSSLSSSSDLTAAEQPLAALSERHHPFNPSFHPSASSAILSAEEMRSPPTTHVVTRKISVKRDNEAPFRLARNASLQQGQGQHNAFASKAERDVYSALGLDGGSGSGSSEGGVPSLGHSPATTPTTPSTFDYSTASPPPASSGRKQLEPMVVVSPESAQGFAPLSSHNLDVGYRSATLSIYGLYDDDDAPEQLKGLPMNDPRVSRHLSGAYTSQGAR